MVALSSAVSPIFVDMQNSEEEFLVLLLELQPLYNFLKVIYSQLQKKMEQIHSKLQKHRKENRLRTKKLKTFWKILKKIRNQLVGGKKAKRKAIKTISQQK